MKKILFVAFTTAFLATSFAQEAKPAETSTEKKECSKGKKCCNKDSKGAKAKSDKSAKEKEAMK